MRSRLRPHRRRAATATASALLLGLAVVGAGTAPGPALAVEAPDSPDSSASATSCSKLEIAAHRGYHLEGIDENTVGSFTAAARRGYAIETDVRRDADGKLWMFHDPKTERATGTPGVFANMTSDQVEALRYVKGGGKVASFDEARAEWARHLGLTVYLEPKDRYSVTETAQALLNEGFADDVIFTSYLMLMAEEHPEFRTLQRAGGSMRDPQLFIERGADSVAYTANQLTPELVDSMHDAGLAVQAKTSNTTEAWRQAIASGVDSILTDEVTQLEAFCPQALTAPTITALSTNTGAPGDRIVITGQTFYDASAVRFGGVSATFTVDSPTQITATVPADAADSSWVKVTTPTGTGTSPEAFTLSSAAQG